MLLTGKMDLRQHISSWLPHLDNEVIEQIVQKLLDCGVQSLEHLKYVVEADLMFLSVVSRRILLEKFQTAASPAVQVSIPQGSEASVSLLGQAFDIPWDAFPPELIKACQDGRRPLKSDLNEMIRTLSDRVLACYQKPGRKVLRVIAREIVSKYPRTFEDTLNGTIIATGLETLLWKLENCINNKRRHSSECSKRCFSEDEELTTKKPQLQKDSYGCVAWQPDLPSTETAETQENKRKELQAQFRLASPNSSRVTQLMAETYSSQRQVINASRSVVNVKENWPFLFEEAHMCSHVNILLGFSASQTFDDQVKTVGRQVFRYAHSLIKKPNVRTCLEEIEKARIETKSMAVEYEATPLLLLAIFDEDRELFCKVVEESASDDDLGDMPCSPFIIAKGGSFLTAKSFVVCVDSLPAMHATNPCQAFKLMFFVHFAFNVAYPKDTSLCLEFTQRTIAGVNPGRGTKVERTKKKQHCLSPKVASLVTSLKDYDF
ncbi:uncharacterized protein [Dermacentor andersoni]|uniref:uncharacterized protein isoform X2 n=1 Tax=Dermacentor andersoni TaxID=34620 RepID=UPI0024165BE4|nr:uncharacterized protein LOC126537830 isoform X3 [Dermacentor andersoni]